MGQVIASLDALVAEHSLLKHPFYQAWTNGSLSLEALRKYAAQYYRHVEAFPRYLSAMHSRCDDAATRQGLLENLIEEERGDDNHPELWLRFAEGLGLKRQEVLDAPALPATRSLVETFNRLSQDMPLAAGLAALYVYESQIPAVAKAKIAGLREFYAIEDQRALGFFSAHEQADVWHAAADAAMIEREVARSGDSTSALAGGGAAVNALWEMLSGVY